MKDYAKKGYKIAGLALVLALLALSTGGITTTNNFYNNSTCSNCSNFSDDSKVNKSGDTMSGALLVQNSSNPTLMAITGISVNATGVSGTSTNSYGVYGLSTNSYGVRGISTKSYGVAGISTNLTGVYGSSIHQYGVYGVSTNMEGVLGSSTNSYGVRGSSTNSYAIYGTSTNSYGIRGVSTNSHGIGGISTNLYGISGASTNSSGVYGTSINSYGVQGSSLYSNGDIFAPNLPASAQTSAVCYNSSTGKITYNSGLTTCVVSTESKKRNIVPISDSMVNSVMQLQPIRYTLDDKPNYGFSAQQVYTIFPELVGKEEKYSTITTDEYGIITKSNPYDGEITGVKYENMVAILTKVIQEQQATINKICGNDQTLCQ